MSHYDYRVWIDFARGTVASDQRASMLAHLHSGCKSCAAELKLWNWMKDFSRQESHNEPSDTAVRVAKLALARGRAEKRNIMNELAELVFDSFAEPQMAGVRGSTASIAGTAAAPRQLLYRAGSVMIDMRMQMASDTDRFALMGQVINSGEKKHALRQVPVHLLNGKDEVASTSTNQFGEFYLEHAVGKDLQVSVEVSSEKNVFIPLDEGIWRVAFGQ